MQTWITEELLTHIENNADCLHMPALCAEIRECWAELRSSSDDKVRIDWIESQGDFIRVVIDPDLEAHVTITSDSFQGRSLRRAIDEARNDA